MALTQVKAAIEAILFAAGEPMPIDKIAAALEAADVEAVQDQAEILMEEINARQGGIMMVRLEDSYQLCSRKEYAPQIREALALHRNVPLTQAALEVLSIVAYNQPVTRAFIDQVRGVDCGAVLQGLIAKSLVEEKGRLELPGRPLLYGTTPDFLWSFSLSSLTDLPPLPQKDEEDENEEEAPVQTVWQDIEETEGDGNNG